ncbi:MAG TPA: D-sedoheptulose 7-phosphate isomerase [Spirochaetia bacterium]|nr:D-sedoheptulose 7-phosphate isomerase [Spirochaetia bacterium]
MSVEQIIREHISVIKKMIDTDFVTAVEQFIEACITTLRNGGTIYFCGNGGSAADAQHWTAELVGRFLSERKALPAVAMTTDTSIITAVGNDYGFENIFARQVVALAKNTDLVVGISTSGTSKNVVKALQIAKEIGALSVGMTGSTGGDLVSVCDICIRIPSNDTARIQEGHALVGHILCKVIDEVDFNG